MEETKELLSSIAAKLDCVELRLESVETTSNKSHDILLEHMATHKIISKIVIGFLTLVLVPFLFSLTK